MSRARNAGALMHIPYIVQEGEKLTLRVLTIGGKKNRARSFPIELEAASRLARESSAAVDSLLRVKVGRWIKRGGACSKTSSTT